MKKYLTLLLVILLIFVRLRVRAVNPLWTDELVEINSLKSVDYLLYTYLPTIPGGSPGHYLLILPLQQFFPFNKYILGLPGLISQILVFIFIPNVISSLQNLSRERLLFGTFIARILFVMDPMLTFQGMEIRPYSVLPLLWIISYFAILKLQQLDDQPLSIKSLYKVLIRWVPALFFIFNWHFYGLIMVLSIYFFILIKKGVIRFSFKKIKYSSIVILVSILLSLPLWFHFSSGSFRFEFNTIATIPTTIMEIYAINKGFPQGLLWQNRLYFFLLLMMLCVFLLQLKKRTYSFLEINIFLVLIPIFLIFISDFVSHYGFWYRQFAWAMLPFYLANGIVLAEIFQSVKEKYMKALLVK